MAKPDIRFVLTIDTEEEWEWDNEFPQENCSVENLAKLPAFQEHCQSLGIRPTYFVDYAVANDDIGSELLSAFHRNNTAEIGAHLHPWCNPPFFGKTSEQDSHVINLPEQQIIQKLDALTEIICKKIGAQPRSFRSGRWGMNGKTLSLLEQRGYKVDSSVYPFYKNEYFTCEGAPVVPYWPAHNDALSPGTQRNIMELPVTAGFNIKNYSLGNQLHTILSEPPFSWFRSVGLLWHSKVLRKLYLSPELTNADDMNLLVNSALKNGHSVIHMYLHSSSLIDGATGLMQTDNAFSIICERMSETIRYLESQANVTYCTITEAALALQQIPNAVRGCK